ncbi:hypothetical protein EB118_13465 [bacterium]|nr:hypothetical protein [bacterium]NDC94598.1 hypothetical protein [bacterium]NDD84824.1 hypothetical protein [bacterium]NDG31061.1 hypothetical protein [bacterium]
MESVFLITLYLDYEGPSIEGVYKTLETAINNAREVHDMYTFVSEYKVNSNKIIRKWRIMDGIAKPLQKIDCFNWEWEPRT